MKQFIANMTISRKILLVTLLTIVFTVCGYGVASRINSLPLSIVIMIAAIGLSLFMARRMTKTILFSLQKIAEVIEDMSDGNLTKRIEVVWKDEIGEIAAHLNVFARRNCGTPLYSFQKAALSRPVRQPCLTMLPDR